MVTKELLNSVEVGNLVKCNDWKKPMKVIGVSDNYFMMIRKTPKGIVYSICEKKRCNHTRNDYTKGCFRIGTDNIIGGIDFYGDWANKDDINQYLNRLENGEIELSARTTVNLSRLKIEKR